MLLGRFFNRQVIGVNILSSQRTYLSTFLFVKYSKLTIGAECITLLSSFLIVDDDLIMRKMLSEKAIQLKRRRMEKKQL
jgi:hypothetical protein